MKFKCVIELAGKTATGLEVPAHIVEALGGGKKPPVSVTIGEYTYRSTVEVMGGRYMLPLSAENRQGAGVAAGDEVEVMLAPDLAPREVEVPEDFANELAKEQVALSFFEGLSYSNQRRIVLGIQGAKTDETRQRRISKAVESLKEGKI